MLVKTLPDGEEIHYSYDALGRLVNVDDGHWPLAYEYDLQDRLVTEHQGWGTLRYEYDSVGQLKHCRLPDGSKLDYHHQPGGQLSSIDLNGSRLTSHQFSAGRELQRQQGLLLSQYQYDDQGRLQAHSVSQREKNLFQRRYDYDANGNLAGIDDSRKGKRSYHYDPLDRLISVRGATPESFAHDPAGNLLGQNNEGTANLANVKGNRLLMQGDRHYDYDAYGNLVRERRGAGQKLVTEYRYDCQHRLIGVSLPGGSTASYKYDAFGRRIEKTVDGHTTEFLWQGERLIAESAANRYRSYLYEPGTFRPLAMLDGEGPRKATPFYYQLDHLGTPQELTDYSGDIMWSAKYRAYGNLAALDVSEIDNPLRFQGQYFDAETGLHYNRHRYYNPGTGRFLTPDPIKLAGGLNNYQYVPNPTGWVDPLGLSSKRASCPTVKYIDPNEVRFSQTSVSYNKVDRDGNNYTYDNLVKSMRDKGWQGDPIDVVRMPDGRLTSMDNTRVRAAREAGINVEARERGYNEPVTEPEQQRFAVKGKKPESWGESIELRVGKQSPKRFGKETPYGSHELPKLSGKE